MNQSKLRMTIVVLVTAAMVFLAAVAARAETPGREAEREAAGWSDRHRSRMIRVRCSSGGSLARAIRRARTGATIAVWGTCHETVTIEKDGLTIKGMRDAVIDGGGLAAEAVVVINAARNITIENLTVRNGVDQGVLAMRQAQGALRGVSMTGNGTVGLSVDRSHLDIEDVSMTDNGIGGMDAYSGSTIVARGDIVATNNGGDGLAANGKTFFEVRGAAVVASDNQGSGISIINDSRLQIFSFPEAQGSSITANNNGFAGIGIPGSELSVVGSQFFGSGANVITASDNFLFGFFMPAGGIFSPHATAKFVATGNRVGMLMEDGASALIVGGLDVTGNGAGVSAVGAGTLTLVSVPPNPSIVNLNQVDLDFGFGTRATIDGVTSSEVACDDTALVRGSASCP